MILENNQPLLLKIIKRYIKNDISRVSEFYEDVKLIMALKRECSKISNGHKSNILAVKNTMITILNCFPHDYETLFQEIFKGQHTEIINTLLFHLNITKTLITINQELLEELKNVTNK